MSRRDPMTVVAERLVRENPTYSCLGLARMLVAESNKALTLAQARSRIKRQLGRNGEHDRKWIRHIDRPPRPSGFKLELPPTKATAWLPHEFPVVGRVGILSDVHIPFHSEIAVKAAVDHLLEVGIDGLLLNGDICDFYSISRFLKDPRQRDFSLELELCREFLAYLRERFPGIPICMKSGNHEERFDIFIWQHAPELSKDKLMCLEQWLHLKDHDIQLIQDGRPIMLGKLPVLHGHELPRGVAAPVNPARGAFMRTLHTVLVGHSHRTSGHAESDMWHGETFCWSTGCLCDLSPDYSRINKYNHGFAVVEVDAGGEFAVHNLRITAEGKVRSS